jgi:hypothetical protein
VARAEARAHGVLGIPNPGVAVFDLTPGYFPASLQDAMAPKQGGVQAGCLLHNRGAKVSGGDLLDEMIAGPRLFLD